MIFFMCVVSIQFQTTLGNNLKKKKKKKKMAVCVSDTLVTLKQDQRNQTWYQSVDLKQSYNKAKFARTR